MNGERKKKKKIGKITIWHIRPTYIVSAFATNLSVLSDSHWRIDSQSRKLTKGKRVAKFPF